MSFTSPATKWFIAASTLACASLAVGTVKAADPPVAQTGSSPPTTTTTTVAPTPAPSLVTMTPSPAATPPSAVPTSQTTTTSAVIETGPSPFAARDLPTTEKVSPVNRPLLITGTLVLAGTWGTSIGFAYGSNRAEDQKYLYYPVAGPWLDLGNRDCNARSCNHEDLNKGLLIADGIGQGLGVLAIFTSLFLPEKTTKRWFLVGSAQSDKSVLASPMRVGSGYGLGALGRF